MTCSAAAMSASSGRSSSSWGREHRHCSQTVRSEVLVGSVPRRRSGRTRGLEPHSASRTDYRWPSARRVVHAVLNIRGGHQLGHRQSRLAVHDRLKGSAGPPSLVAQGSGVAGCPARRKMVTARLRRLAMMRGPSAVRIWRRSSSKSMSRIQYRRYSIPQCPRQALAGSGRSAGLPGHCRGSPRCPVG